MNTYTLRNLKQSTYSAVLAIALVLITLVVLLTSVFNSVCK